MSSRERKAENQSAYRARNRQGFERMPDNLSSSVARGSSVIHLHDETPRSVCGVDLSNKELMDAHSGSRWCITCIGYATFAIGMADEVVAQALSGRTP